MPKKEKKQENWKTAAYCALCAIGVYLALQGLNAALIARELVGEARAAMLVWMAAGISTFLGVGIMGRKCRAGRMLLGAGGAAGWLLAVLVCTLLAGRGWQEIVGQLIPGTAAAAAGGAGAALLLGPRRGREREGGRARKKRRAVT